MFRRLRSTSHPVLDPDDADTSSETTLTRRSRHSRRALAREAADAAALEARLARVQRRLAEVSATPAANPATGRSAAIDDSAARRDPRTRPFPMAFAPQPASAGDDRGRRVRSLGTDRSIGSAARVR